MFVHGQNLTQKEARTDYSEASEEYLREIRTEYDKWKQANIDLRGPGAAKSEHDDSIIIRRVALLARYKDFIDQQKYAEAFDSRSNLHSSVLEEFIYYLFRDLVADFGAGSTVGKASTFKDIFFAPPSYAEMVKAPHALIEKKDHDFVIGAKISVEIRCGGAKTGQIEDVELPAVAIECKTYLDKTMLEGSSMTADQIKVRTPNAIYIVVMEWIKLAAAVNVKKFKVDQIYILRKQKNTDREYRFLPDYEKNPIYPEVVIHLFETVREHLTQSWTGGVTQGLDRGYLL